MYINLEPVAPNEHHKWKRVVRQNISLNIVLSLIAIMSAMFDYELISTSTSLGKTCMFGYVFEQYGLLYDFPVRITMLTTRLFVTKFQGSEYTLYIAGFLNTAQYFN